MTQSLTPAQEDRLHNAKATDNFERHLELLTDFITDYLESQNHPVDDEKDAIRKLTLREIVGNGLTAISQREVFERLADFARTPLDYHGEGADTTAATADTPFDRMTEDRMPFKGAAYNTLRELYTDVLYQRYQERTDSSGYETVHIDDHQFRVLDGIHTPKEITLCKQSHRWIISIQTPIDGTDYSLHFSLPEGEWPTKHPEDGDLPLTPVKITVTITHNQIDNTTTANATGRLDIEGNPVIANLVEVLSADGETSHWYQYH